MRLTVKECKFCPLNMGCDHKKHLSKTLRTAFGDEGIGMNFITKCTKYPTIFSRGDLVEFMAFDHRKTIEHLLLAGGQTKAIDKWKHEPNGNGLIRGRITGEISKTGGFYIRLLKPIVVIRKNTLTNDEETRETNLYSKQANAMALIEKWDSSIYWEDEFEEKEPEGFAF